MLSEPINGDSDVKLDMVNDSKDKDNIVGYPIVYNKQFLGYLLPNSVLDEHFKIVEESHPGIHYTYGFYRKGLPENQVKIYSLHKWDDVKKRLDKTIKEHKEKDE